MRFDSRFSYYETAEICLDEFLGHFFADLETIGADARAHGGMYAGWSGSESTHFADSRGADAPYGSAPARMHRVDNTRHGIEKNHRDTVGRMHAYCNPGPV